MSDVTSSERISTEIGDLRMIAEAFAALGARLAGHDTVDPFDAVTSVARDQLPAAAGASVTLLRAQGFSTVAATDERIRRADAIQYELGSGPCLDAIVSETMYRPRDLRTDTRWPDYGRRVADELGLDSMLSYRMLLPADDTVAGLNLYAEQPDAFTDRDALIGLLLATHGAQVASSAIYGRHVHHLKRALKTNRGIGVAVGVLMATHKVTEQQAFDLLRIASQNSNRKLADIAADVVETGRLDVSPDAHSRHRRSTSSGETSDVFSLTRDRVGASESPP
jgi:ANTAR domain